MPKIKNSCLYLAAFTAVLEIPAGTSCSKFFHREDTPFSSSIIWYVARTLFSRYDHRNFHQLSLLLGL